jgi:hypothetical protein
LAESDSFDEPALAEVKEEVLRRPLSSTELFDDGGSSSGLGLADCFGRVGEGDGELLGEDSEKIGEKYSELPWLRSSL